MVGRYVVSESVHVKENYADMHLNTLRNKGWTLKTPRMIRVVSRSVSVVIFTLVTYHITRYSIELSHSWLRELTKCVFSLISDPPLSNGTSAGVKWANEEPYLIVIIRFLILPSKCLRYRIKVS